MLKDYLSDFFIKAYDIDMNLDYELLEIMPENLINSKRIDIIFKILFLELKDKCPEFAKIMYQEHVRAMTKNSFVEAGSNKTNIQSFIDEFIKLYNSIKSHNYADEYLPIPVDKNMQIMDGAHRVAVCFVLNKKVKVVKLPIMAKYDNYNYEYFLNQNINQEYLDCALLRYGEISTKVCCFNIWPSAFKYDSQIEDELMKNFNVIYKKRVSLNEVGAFNYLMQIYSEYSWANDESDGYAGIYRKLVPCFPTFDPISFYIVEVNTYEGIEIIKNNIRSLFELEKHSIHSTDNYYESLQMMSILLSKTSIEFLNNANVTKFNNTFKFIKQAVEKSVNNHIVFTGSIVLALYGIREANDLDFLSLDYMEFSHNDLIQYYDKSLEELLFNPENYYSFFNVKFLTLENIKKFKKNRNESKDIEDLKLIDMVLMHSNKKNMKIKFIQFKRRFIAKVQGSILRIAHRTGTYHFLRNIYKSIKKNK